MWGTQPFLTQPFLTLPFLTQPFFTQTSWRPQRLIQIEYMALANLALGMVV
jgi:hypothetical protein